MIPLSRVTWLAREKTKLSRGCSRSSMGGHPIHVLPSTDAEMACSWANAASKSANGWRSLSTRRVRRSETSEAINLVRKPQASSF